MGTVTEKKGAVSDPAIEMGHLWQRPGFLIRRLNQIHVALFFESCKGFEITPVQYGLLTTNGHYLTAVGGGGRITDVIHSDATRLLCWQSRASHCLPWIAASMRPLPVWRKARMCSLTPPAETPR